MKVILRNAIIAVALGTLFVVVPLTITIYLGGLPFTSSQPEAFDITGVAYPAADQIVLSVENLGTNHVEIRDVTINDVSYDFSTGGGFTDNTLASGVSGTVTITTYSWISGNKYIYGVTTARGFRFFFTGYAP